MSKNTLAEQIQFAKQSMVALADLSPYDNNAREHSESQIEMLANAILRFGWTNPLVVCSATNRIAAGHGRYLAAQRLGLKEVPVVAVDNLTDEDFRALSLADNKLALNAQWNYSKLEDELRSLSLDTAELAGFVEDEYMAILGLNENDQDSEEGDPESEGQAANVQSLVLVFSNEQYERVSEKLSEINESPEIALCQLLGL